MRQSSFVKINDLCNHLQIKKSSAILNRRTKIIIHLPLIRLTFYRIFLCSFDTILKMELKFRLCKWIHFD